MNWRILLTGVYAAAWGVLMALQNVHPDMSSAPLLALWLAAPIVGFAVGRWWALIAVVAALVGRTIGWDRGENDGNPALWPPYVVSSVLSLGLPLLAGLALSRILPMWRERNHHVDSAPVSDEEPSASSVDEQCRRSQSPVAADCATGEAPRRIRDSR